jgi:O-antigen ligase
LNVPAIQEKSRYGIFSAIFILSVFIALWLKIDYFYLIPFAVLFTYAGWQEPTLAFYALLFTLPISTELGVSGNLSTDFPDESLMILCTGLFICSWLYKPSIFSKKLFSHPLLLLLVLSIVWVIVPVIASDYSLFSLKFLAAKIWYLGAFVFFPIVLLRDKGTLITSIKIISSSMLIVVLISLARHGLDGFTFLGINASVKPFFRNHVNYSAMLVCFIPIFISLFVFSKKSATKNILLVAILVMLAALFFSYARGAWLALFTGAIAYWLIRKKLLVWAYAIVLVITVFLFFWIQDEKRYLQYAHDFRSTIYHENFRDHLKATYELKDVSTAERFYRWIAGARMIKERPITGFGPNTFYHNYKGFAIPAFKTWVSKNEEHSTVHNYFLLLAIEQGVPGLLLFLLLVGLLLYYSQRLYHRVTDAFYRAIAINCGIIIVMIMTVNFMSDLIETDKIGSLFLLCLSLLMITDFHNPERKRQIRA